MSSSIHGTFSIAPAGSITAKFDGQDRLITRWHHKWTSACHGFWYDALLVVPSALFLLYLGLQAKRNLKMLGSGGGNGGGGRSYVMIVFYVLLWSAALLNLTWCSLQAWQCTPGKQVAWSLLSLIAASGMLCLEISFLAFLLQESYANGLETLAHSLNISGILVGVDMLLKAILIFGFGIPLFIDVEVTHQGKWAIWFIHKLLLTAAYGYILFVHYSKWRDKLPPRPAFYKYVIVMFVGNVMVLLATGLAGMGTGFGLWLHNFSTICYHSLYLPYVYTTFLTDFFQEEEWLLDSAYYSEMRDAGFLDAEWN